jgi:vacuolar-type H+-ATPase subunit I/STV1
MKNRIDTAIAKIGKTMQEQLANQHFDSVANTSTVLARVRQLQKQYEKIEQELPEIEEIVKNLSSKTNGHTFIYEAKKSDNPYQKVGRAVPQTIRIKIDWKVNKRNKDKEEIHALKATEVMTEFIARLIEEFGKEAQQKLFQVRANRGPLLSRSPEKDFGSYQYKRIRGTDCFLLTHSSTPEKVDLLEKICRVLGLVPGSVEIKAEGRFDSFEKIIT